MASKIDLSTLSYEEMIALGKDIQARKRDHKAKAERAKVKAIFAPLFDAIDTTIASNPALKELIEEKDAIRVYFNDKQKVDRDSYNSYAQREYNGNGGGQKQYKRKGSTTWVDVPNTTWKSACPELNVTVNKQSAQAALNAAGYDTQVLDDDGVVISEKKGK